MEITTPVTDYIRASLLTTLNDIVVRGAAQPARQPGLLKAIGTVVAVSSRGASGNQVVSGVGFSPSVVIFVATDNNTSNYNWSVGFDNADTAMCLVSQANNTQCDIDGSYSLKCYRSGGEYIYGAISSMNADGFTIAWTAAGAPVPAIDFVYCALP